MLTDIAFNVQGGLNSYPQFTQAVLTDDVKVMTEQYKRYYTNASGQRLELTQRNEEFYNTYLKPLVVDQCSSMKLIGIAETKSSIEKMKDPV